MSRDDGGEPVTRCAKPESCKESSNNPVSQSSMPSASRAL